MILFFACNFNAIYSFKFLVIMTLKLERKSIFFFQKMDCLHNELGHSKVVASILRGSLPNFPNGVKIM
jgi:hypothetical protein